MLRAVSLQGPSGTALQRKLCWVLNQRYIQILVTINRLLIAEEFANKAWKKEHLRLTTLTLTLTNQ